MFRELIQAVSTALLVFITSITPTVTYTEGVTGQPQSFLPTQATSQTDKTISSLLYRGLFKYDVFGNLVPDLAESWQISEDGLVYTITLKNNQFWSDGSRITSDDLIFTSFQSPNLQGVATDRVDDLTVRFTLPNKFSPFLSLMTNGVMKQQDEIDPLLPISNGAFKVLSVQKSGPLIKDVVLIRHDGEGEIEKIIFRYYSNEDELEIAAKLGEIDAFVSNSEHDLENFENQRFPIQSVYFALFFNLENETLSDVELRQKLLQSVDVEKIIFDKGIPVEGPISKSRFTNKELDFNQYDEDLSEDLEDVKLTIVIPDLESHSDIATRISDIWEDKLDVDVEILRVDADGFVERVINNGEFQIILYGQEIGRDPDRYVNWHSTQKVPNGLNISNFEQVRADRALEEGRNTIDNQERVVHYNEFQKVVEEEVPAMFLYHPYKNFYVSNYFEGIGEKYTFTARDRFLDLANWTKIQTN